MHKEVVKPRQDVAPVAGKLSSKGDRFNRNQNSHQVLIDTKKFIDNTSPRLLGTVVQSPVESLCHGRMQPTWTLSTR